MTGPRPVSAPRGTDLNTLGWQQEAAFRMLQNNLDPEVAEHPEELVVYGGTGKAARNWASFDAMLRTLPSDDCALNPERLAIKFSVLTAHTQMT